MKTNQHHITLFRVAIALLLVAGSIVLSGCEPAAPVAPESTEKMGRAKMEAEMKKRYGQQGQQPGAR